MKQNIIPSAGTKVDSDMQPIAGSSSHNSSKPIVSGIPNRSLKFRAWVRGYMADVKSIDFANQNVLWDDNQWDRCYPPNKMYEIEPLENSVLMQFTGLQDSKGTDIYEGDICKRPSSNGTKEQMCYGIIEFYKGSFCFKREHSNLRIAVDNICYHYADCEIIGNVFQNPELLG